MLLHTIKLAGFKSFVDPTTIRLPSKLVSIVGPNGCGKSNIIDAVRWVMGENSPKELRGENRIDFIFKGSSNRKPVGQASVELTFDNPDGRLGGAYANYAEIVVRRTLNTQGDSQYYLNGTPCRRSDVTALFLGTGLGPRSYAIIQQGMIGRLIEAKPDELRTHIEEAAGITRYKERRRETVIRIEHTRANLLRLTDIRGELEQQLTRINKQAEVAIRYQKLVDQEIQCKQKVQALQWQMHGTSIAEYQQTIQKLQTQMEAIRAEQAGVEKQASALHAELGDTTLKLEALRTTFYEQGRVISHLEAVEKEREHKRFDATHQHTIVEQQLITLQQTLQQDIERLHNLAVECDRLKPMLAEQMGAFEVAQQHFREQQSMTDQVQQSYEAALSQYNQSKHEIQVLEMRLEHTRSHLMQLQEKYIELENDLANITCKEDNRFSQEKKTETAEAEAVIHNLQAEWIKLREYFDQKHADRNTLSDDLSELRDQLHIESEAYAVLTALQDNTYGKESHASQWLTTQGLHTSPRLLQQLVVTPGWEHAVETVLTHLLHAVGVEDAHAYLDQITDAQTITLLNTISKHSGYSDHHPRIQQPLLISKITSHWPLQHWLKDIYIAEDTASARHLVHQLEMHESVITQEGVWMGPHWIHVNRVVQEKEGVFTRQKNIQIRKKTLERLRANIQDAEENLRRIDIELATARAAQEPLRQKIDAAQKIHAQYLSELRVIEERHQNNDDRYQLLTQKYTEVGKSLIASKAQYALLENQYAEILQGMESKENALQLATQLRDQAKTSFCVSQDALDKIRTICTELKLALDTTLVEHTTLQHSHERLLKQKIEYEARLSQLNHQMTQLSLPDDKNRAQLKQTLEAHIYTEKELAEIRASYDQKQQQHEQHVQQSHVLNLQLQQLYTEISALQRMSEALAIKQKFIRETFEQEQISLEDILNVLKEQDLTLEAWMETLHALSKRISAFGPVNLVAPEEQKTLAERKMYLDAQHEDLMEALNTLEGAIKNIDQETREQFFKTYESVNAHFQSLFPKVFAGGKAELRLLEDDLLTTGISVIAQPPGKRNSSIHLLSGGEKALTALALIFALFQLNPAPFCLLDEVDAPLDDANVQRFCALVKSMAENTQFIVVTHNKLAMEMAEHLIGVTMQEPGVSRLVAVDVKAALALAEVE